jgi:ABC-type transport system involved in multi-copper enzyme maturation permease subunit
MLTIAGFEFRSRLKLISTWVYFAVFFALALAWMAAAGGLFKDANIAFGSGKVAINSPFALMQTVVVLGLFGVSVMAAIMGRAVQQDFEYRTQHFFFTSPISKTQYLVGRFVGAIGVVLVVFSSIALGAFVATWLPGMDAERLGPNRWAAYLLPYLLVLLPNAILIGGVFFSLAATTRKMLPVYVGSVLVLIGWLIAQQLIRDIDNKTIAALIDPFGTRAISLLTEYWTISERNTRLVPLEGHLLWNRLLWLGVGLAISVLCGWRFSFSAAAQERGGKRTAARAETEAVVALPATGRGAPQPGAVEIASRPWALLPALAAGYFRETVKNIYFGVLVLAGLLFMIFASTTGGNIFGTTTWPLTFQMLDLLKGSFSIFMLIIIAFYAGEMVWREREHRLDQISDGLPVPTWLPMLAKLLALMAVPLLLQLLLMATGIGIQASKGFFRFEPGLYLHDLIGIQLIDYWLLCVLALTVHSVVNHKYVGHFAMVVYYALILFASQLGLEHHLYKFGSVPPAVYSDINGFGHFMTRVRAFQAYWWAASLLLLVAAYLMWTRGTVSGWRERLVVARQRLTAPTMVVAFIGVAGMAATGGFIFYNTNVLNHYETAFDAQQRQADYERKYKPLLAAEPQPKITAVKLTVDLFPAEQRVRMRGSYTLENRSSVPVTTLNLNFRSGRTLVLHRVEPGLPSSLVADDMALGVRRYTLLTPLAPGQTTTLAFDIEQPTHGFTNEGSNTAVVYNGSFVNGGILLPTLGYEERGELERDQDRRKFGLAPKERMRNRDDPSGPALNVMAHDADFIAFDATVGTEPDQIAIAPGYLQRDWLEGGRRYFHYTMDAPILDFFAFQSARYAVRKDTWHRNDGGADVALEVYYQPGHEYNLDAMVAASKAALDYNSRHFGAYQYRQFRIVEFPRYEAFAQSFPNTVPYSEGIGFIARVRPGDPKDIDYPYYVTAHEAAHQWWGHQVVAADVQGSSMLIETLAQYSALMVMKQHVGAAKMRKFLAYEMDRYLLGRALEQKKELPLARVEDQPYIHYRKGSVVMYALADYIGEERLDEAIRRYRDAHAFQGAPYPTTAEFLARVREVTPPEMQYLVTDMFERIVIYDNHAVSATAKALSGGRYEVTVKVAAKKFVADELGKESEVPLGDLIDIGVLDAQGDPIAIERHRIDRADMSFSLIVDRKPARAGIDPLNKLIDRKPEDNTISVTEASN